MDTFIGLSVCIMIGLSVSSEISHHQIIFPSELSSTFPVVRASTTLPSGMDEFTICFWARFMRSGQNTVFSYAQPKNDNEIVMNLTFHPETNLTDLYIWRANARKIFNVLPVKKGVWFHGCVSWSSYLGETTMYVDGKCFYSEEGLTTGNTIVPGGVIILGNDQDSMGGGFDAAAQFSGGMTGVNVWDRVLQSHQVASLANCSSTEEGNIISWSKTRMGLYNGAEIDPIGISCPRQKSCSSQISMPLK